MAKGFNRVILMGNLTRDPETRTTNTGQTVTNFGLAVNRTWRGADGNQQESVSYIDCVAWAKTGEVIAQYVGKGRPLLISGRLEQRSWEQDGQKRSKVEVVVEDFNFIDSRGGASTNSDNSEAKSRSNPAKPADKKGNKDTTIEDVEEPINLDDIPF
ncbi:single-stranded DNA-binding protein [Candidatus Parcubacteria bacterium]|nr:single-stranded DNA-binding protein [Candidatus Parcubacteria bacterium]